MLHERHCSSWKSEVKISLCSRPFPSLLYRPTAELAVVFHSLNTLSTVPVWLPAKSWAMGKGQETDSRSPNSHPLSCLLSESGMQRTFPSPCKVSHGKSRPFSASTSVPFLSLRLWRGQALVGSSWALNCGGIWFKSRLLGPSLSSSVSPVRQRSGHHSLCWAGKKQWDEEDGEGGPEGSFDQQLEGRPSQDS